MRPRPRVRVQGHLETYDAPTHAAPSSLALFVAMLNHLFFLFFFHFFFQGIRSQPQLTAELLHSFGDEAHGLKSGISMIGCRRLALLCYKLELYGQTGTHQNAQAVVTLYDTYMPTILQQTMQALQIALAAP